MDDIGVVYFDDGIVVRAIHNEMQAVVIELMDSGLIDHLVSENLFPKTQVSERKIEGHELIIEHERIDPLTYPFEWSPEMLRHAGLCVLKVNSIANSYGYELKDSHVYNVVFKHNQPMCVDFGSLVKKNDNYCWLAYARFKCAYIYALKIYRLGGARLFNNLFLVSGKAIEESEYLKVRYPVFRMFKTSTLTKLSDGFTYYRNVKSISQHVVQKKIRNENIANMVSIVADARILSFLKFKQQSLENKLTNISWSNETTWGTYHERVGLYSGVGEIKLSDRLKSILEIIEKLGVTTVIELAGNQGVFSRKIAKLPSIKNVICSDYDENAIDKLLLNLEENENITPVVLDFMRVPIASRGNLSTDRFRSDLVVALAVTHHLILGQGYSLDYIFSSMVKYARRYLIVEFMPIGLYSKRSGSRPPVPDWYNEAWFVETLIKYGKILKRLDLEENRIAFVLEVSVVSD